MNSNHHRSADHSPSAQPAGSKRWRWVSGGLLVLLFSPILVVAIWYVCVRISNSRAVTRLEMEIRQRGEPLTVAELQGTYAPIPDEQNAAVALLALWEKEDPAYWKAIRQGTRPLPEHASREVDPAVPILGSKAAPVVRGVALDAASLAAAKEYVKKETDHLGEAHEALLRRRAHFPLNFDEGFNMLLPHLASVKREAQNFRLSALVAAEQGNVEASIAALQDVARTGQILGDDPILISHLVRIACLAIAISGTEDLVSRLHPDTAQLEQLKSLLEEMKVTGGLKQSLLGERAFALGIFERGPQAAAALSDPESTDGAGRSQKIAVGAMKFIGLAAADKRLMLETFKPVIAAADQEAPESVREIERSFQAAGVKARQFPPKVFSGMMLPGLERVAFKFAAQEARRRAALVAVAIEQYRLQHAGKPPEKLEQLVPQFLPEVPADPFDGQPLRFRTLEKGYVVYSIGADRNDDGGKERKLGKGGSQNFDDTFIVEH